MNVDTLLVLALAAFFLIGFVRGFIREVGAIIGFFVSIWLAGQYYMLAVPYIRPSLSQWPFIADSLSVVVAFFGTFIVSQILFGFVIRILDFFIRRLSPIPFLKTTNRLLGGAVGVVEGVFFLSVILFVFTTFPISKDLAKRINDSKLAGQIIKISKLITPLLPNISSFTPQFLNQPFPDQKALEQLLKNSNLPAIDPSKIDISKIDLKAFGIDEKTLPPEVQTYLKAVRASQVPTQKK